MNKYFSRENFIFSTFDKKQKIQSLIVSFLLILFFVFSSFTFFNALYAFTNEAGSIVSGSLDVAIKDFLRSIPLFLTCFMSIWALLLIHALFRNASREKRICSLKKNSICLLVFVTANLIYIIFGLIIGKYVSIIEGSPSPIYPLDSILYSLIYLALGIFVLIYLAKLQNKWPYVVFSRGPIVKKARFIYCLGITIWMLVALFGFSAGIFSLFIYDFKHEYVFYGIITIFAYLLSPIFLWVWQFYYNELKQNNKKIFLLPLSIIGLVLSITASILYFVSLGIAKDAPSNAGFGMFPITFAANIDIATIVVVLTPLIVSIIAFIKALIYKRQNTK